jgi:hypothetical protein
MRYRELVESPARPWKKYRGWRHAVTVMPTNNEDGARLQSVECVAFFGDVVTGRQEVLHSQFVSIGLPTGEEVFGEHPRCLRDALRQVSTKAAHRGWKVLAIGRTPEFRETGLSANSGYGIHPSIPNRHVHMLDPPPTGSNKD